MTTPSYSPNDPTQEPLEETTMDLSPADTAAVPAAVEPAPQAPAKRPVKGSFAGSTWVALIAGLLLLIGLLVFILQNQQKVEITLFTWTGTVPAGVGFLLAAILGALIMALVGGVRMLELRRQVKRAARRN
ncbi:DUF1049 domain-containing protein [Corynebacterium sp. 13CS0277]|uniref:LapA family protein n=1 Tax=Corynebacterium sp. 13CS0277 TaxID=2071994 RepID=UPI000D03D126|nr:lipopolysaccharide assembly protein LapA domain-containing protein [Corynebacterium sp. 13CS0277]PRQ12569.1 DUF1049 domain-containing protein [Corynebacterium sp. 13CS0277]